MRQPHTGLARLVWLVTLNVNLRLRSSRSATPPCLSPLVSLPIVLESFLIPSNPPPLHSSISSIRRRVLVSCASASAASSSFPMFETFRA